MNDPVTHARMTMLIQQEKKLKEELKKLDEELPMWSGRVELALKKGKEDLARQAQQRVRDLQERQLDVRHELDSITSQKKDLRFQARRPSGREVQRSEAMVESVRQGGLIDPDEASLERELDELGKSNVTLDFGDEDES